MCIGTLKLDGKTYSIRLTDHAKKRMQEREVKEVDAINTISGIDEKKLKRLRETEKEAVLIDVKNKIAIVVGFEKNKNQIVLITAFNSNYYSAYKETTKIAV